MDVRVARENDVYELNVTVNLRNVTRGGSLYVIENVDIGEVDFQAVTAVLQQFHDLGTRIHAEAQHALQDREAVAADHNLASAPNGEQCKGPACTNPNCGYPYDTAGDEPAVVQDMGTTLAEVHTLLCALAEKVPHRIIAGIGCAACRITRIRDIAFTALNHEIKTED